MYCICEFIDIHVRDRQTELALNIFSLRIYLWSDTNILLRVKVPGKGVP